MTTRFIGGESIVWQAMTKAAKAAARAHVAVAYFGKGGARQLPLKRGSVLVVDACEARVKAGATCPDELLKLVRRGVEVYSCPNLHAKVFVFSKKVFVGSANVSAGSGNLLSEAVVQTTDTDAVRQAREFVVGLMRDRLGPEELKVLQEKYNSPRVPGGKSGGRRSKLQKVWYDTFEPDDLPSGSEADVEQGEDEAAEVMTEGYVLEYVWRSGSPRYRTGDTIIQYSKVDRMVTCPARVIYQKQWSNGRTKYTFSYTERPDTNRVSIDNM